MPAWVQALLPVITLVLGASLTYLTEGRREAQRAARERAARTQERREAMEDRRNEFELEHLLRARDALREALAAAVAEYHAFARAVMWKGPKVSPLTGSISEEHDALDAVKVRALGQLQSAMVLVLDDDCRELVRQAGYRLSDDSKDERAARDAVAEAMQAIGERVRTIYGDP